MSGSSCDSTLLNSSHYQHEVLRDTSTCPQCLESTFKRITFSPICNQGLQTETCLPCKRSSQSSIDFPLQNRRLQSNSTGNKPDGSSYRPCHKQVEPVLEASRNVAAQECGLVLEPSQSCILVSVVGVPAQFQHADNVCANEAQRQGLLTAYFYILNLDEEQCQDLWHDVVEGRQCLFP